MNQLETYIHQIKQNPSASAEDQQLVSDYEELRRYHDQIHKAYDVFMEGYPTRIRRGILCIFLIPLFFMILMFLHEAKLFFLSLWIISIIIIATYLILLEYTKIRWYHWIHEGEETDEAH